MVEIKELIVILSSYALGCFTTGYYWVRYQTGGDIRESGSAAAGAQNAGRVLGVSGFAITFFGDFAKGVLTVSIAYYFGLTLTGVLLAIHAVVAGHIWPLQLGFRGGKGIATAFGALLSLDPKLTAALVLIAAAGAGLCRKITPSGLLAVTLSPVVAAAMNRPPVSVMALTTLSIVILFAHRRNLHDIWKQMKSNTETSSSLE